MPYPLQLKMSYEDKFCVFTKIIGFDGLMSCLRYRCAVYPTVGRRRQLWLPAVSESLSFFANFTNSALTAWRRRCHLRLRVRNRHYLELSIFWVFRGREWDRQAACRHRLRRAVEWRWNHCRACRRLWGETKKIRFTYYLMRLGQPRAACRRHSRTHQNSRAAPCPVPHP